MIGNDGNGPVEEEALWNSILDLRKKLEKVLPGSDLLSKELEGFFRASNLGILNNEVLIQPPYLRTGDQNNLTGPVRPFETGRLTTFHNHPQGDYQFGRV
ncbi:hypothetical protein NE237_019503 [Protea cynaroides]|uniref:Uncharacterized protein n=1 Tax=Protea cynaroides TaxID=273540 RepID=A0A9Q0JS89_9MAGN|nr:hypothetical protein NE237_019503 [Protea cynaroides]